MSVSLEHLATPNISKLYSWHQLWNSVIVQGLSSHPKCRNSYRLEFVCDNGCSISTNSFDSPTLSGLMFSLWLPPLRCLPFPAALLQTLRQRWQINGVMILHVIQCCTWRKVLRIAMCLFRLDKDLQTWLPKTEVLWSCFKGSVYCSNLPWDFIWLMIGLTEKSMFTNKKAHKLTYVTQNINFQHFKTILDVFVAFPWLVFRMLAM